MAKGLSNLQSALEAARPNGTKPEPKPEPATAKGYRAPSREGKTNLTAYLPVGYKANLRLIQARLMVERGSVTTESLIAEALNDLFVKYGVPTLE